MRVSNLRIMSSRAVKGAVSAIAAQFSRATGCATSFDFAPVGTIEAKLAAGALADVIILSTAALSKIETSLVPGSRRPLGRTSIGVAVRDGAAVPDIAVGGTAGKYLARMFEQIGVADAIDRKALRCASGADVTQCVADGQADIGMTFISEMLPIPGARVEGPLPPPLGSDTTYEAGVALSSGERAIAMALIAALTQPDA